MINGKYISNNKVLMSWQSETFKRSLFRWPKIVVGMPTIQGYSEVWCITLQNINVVPG